MIISQTPYRVSFAGGGTDLPAFYRTEYGAVISLTINRHMYVTVHGRFEPNIRVAYSKVELARTANDIQHELVREAMRRVGLDEPIEITTIGDVPAGTGLGSSSALTVGLLHALHGYRGQIVSREQLAREACQIEIEILKKPIGRQDQYASAYGGLSFMRFDSDDTVTVEPVPVEPQTLFGLESRAMLLCTNHQRDADTILAKQSAGTAASLSVLRAMRDLAFEMRGAITGEADLDEFARLLHEGWLLKRSLGFGISNDFIDQWYDAARDAGAQGGKLLGAGSGGFVFLLAPPERQKAVREALGRPQELEFSVDRLGSRIIFISERH